MHKISFAVVDAMPFHSIYWARAWTHTHIYRCLISPIYAWQSLCSSIYVHSHFRYFSTLHSVCNKFSGETLNINLLLCPFFAFSPSLPSFGVVWCGVCSSRKPDMDVGSAWMTAEPVYHRMKTDLQHRQKKANGKRDRNLQSEHNICVLCMYEPANDITCFLCWCCCYCWVM